MGSPWQRVLQRVHLPLLRGPITVGLLLVFVDTVKELPLTFALRPFDFDTLSVLQDGIFWLVWDASSARVPEDQLIWAQQQLASI